MYRMVLTYETTRKTELRTITSDLRACIAEARVDGGTVVAYSLHTTLGLAIQETGEPNLCEDFADFLGGLVEGDGNLYQHRCALHPSGACDEDRFNAPSHVRQLLTNQPIVLDVQGGDMALGQWQDIALVEWDGPRAGRQILVKILPDRA